MIPFPAKGYARRKPCTENPSARFDEETEVEMPLFYSTHPILAKLRVRFEIRLVGWILLLQEGIEYKYLCKWILYIKEDKREI